MDKLKAYNDLVMRVYEAAHQPEAWQIFLEELALFSNSASGMLTIENFAEAEIQIMSQVGFEQKHLEQYADYYFSVDPWLPRLLDYKGFASTDQLVALPDFLNSEMHNDWAKEQNIQHAIGGNVQALSGGYKVRLAMQRNRGVGEYRKEELDWFNMLEPHLERALTLAQKLQDRQNTASHSLDTIEAAVFLCTETAKCSDHNQAADTLLANNPILRLRDGHLILNDITAQAALMARLHDLLATDIDVEADSVSQGPIVIEVANNEQFEIMVLPWRGSSQLLGFSALNTAAVFVRSFSQKLHVSQQYLRKLFGFTTVEAAVASALVSGVSAQRLAWSMGVMESTTRSHIKAILAKTGCRSQQELISLLLSTHAKYAN